MEFASTMMPSCHLKPGRTAFLWLLCVLGVGLSYLCADEADEFTVLSPEKQPVQALSFFVHHAPARTADVPTKPATFKPLPPGVTAHLAEIGYLAGRQLYAVRYLLDSRLAHGNTGAVGLVILSSVASQEARFKPLLVAWSREEDAVSDLSASIVHQEAGLAFFWVRRLYSGTGHFVERIAISAPANSKPSLSYPIFADTDPLATLTKAGWESWHRGNFFDEDTLTGHYHLYLPHPNADQTDVPTHRYLQVRYHFREGKLYPDPPEDDPTVE